MGREIILDKIKSFATELLSSDTVCKLCYHNIEHTNNVVKNAEYIGVKEGVTEEEMFILIATAWFHDLGYAKVYNGHEDESIKMAREFLQKENVEQDLIDAIANAIDATRVPQIPKNKIEQVISDADLFDLGTDDFFTVSEKLYDEWNICIKPASNIKLWNISLNFLKEHKYFTNFAKEYLEPKKLKNILILEARLKNRSIK